MSLCPIDHHGVSRGREYVVQGLPSTSSRREPWMYMLYHRHRQHSDGDGDSSMPCLLRTRCENGPNPVDAVHQPKVGRGLQCGRLLHPDRLEHECFLQQRPSIWPSQCCVWFKVAGLFIARFMLCHKRRLVLHCLSNTRVPFHLQAPAPSSSRFSFHYIDFFDTTCSPECVQRGAPEMRVLSSVGA